MSKKSCPNHQVLYTVGKDFLCWIFLLTVFPENQANKSYESQKTLRPLCFWILYLTYFDSPTCRVLMFFKKTVLFLSHSFKQKTLTPPNAFDFDIRRASFFYRVFIGNECKKLNSKQKVKIWCRVRIGGSFLYKYSGYSFSQTVLI